MCNFIGIVLGFCMLLLINGTLGVDDDQDSQMCIGKPTGTMFPNPDDCTSFYYCEYDKGTKFKCGAGMLFDPIQSKCDLAIKVNCKSKPTIRTKRTTTTTKPTTTKTTTIPTTETTNPTTKTTSAATTTITPVTTKTPSNTPTTKKPSTTHKPEITKSTIPTVPSPRPTLPSEPETTTLSCTSENYGLMIPDVNNCSVYYVCANLEWNERYCPEGLVFNANKSVCDWPNDDENLCKVLFKPTNVKVQAKKRMIDMARKMPEICNLREDTEGLALMANPNDCRLFFVCVGQRQLNVECHEGYHWHQENMSCIEEKDSTCLVTEQV